MQVTGRYPYESGRDYALRIIKKNIINLELEPRSRVNDRALAEELGLSRTPVREALIELSKSNVVQIYPQSGSIIAPIDYDIMEEAHTMREILECAVVEMCCKVESIDELGALEENLRLQEFYLEHRTADKLMDLDNEFHKLLFTVAKMPHVHSLMENFTIHFDRVRYLSYQAIRDVTSVGGHRKILDAVVQHDVPRAVEKMRKHLNNYQVEREELMERYPQYFA